MRLGPVVILNGIRVPDCDPFVTGAARLDRGALLLCGGTQKFRGIYSISTKTKREWKSPQGYRFLTAWSNAVLLEILVRKFTATLVTERKNDGAKGIYSLLAGKAGKLEDVKGEELSYEIFIELINKTDYLLRTLVVSLQKHADYSQELKKDPRAAQERENDKWLADVMKRYKG